MNTALDLAALLRQVPRDAQGAFKEGPEAIAFAEALAAAAPVDPSQLLELAASLRSDAGRSRQADAVAHEALSAIAHDRTVRRIVSRIGGEVTPWGVTVNQLRAQIIRAYRAPGPSTTRWREIPGASARVGLAEGDTRYFAAAPGEASGGAGMIAARLVHGRLYVTSD